MEYKYDTIEYVIEHTLRDIMRLDSQYNLLKKIVHNPDSDMDVKHIVRLTRMICNNVNRIFELYPVVRPEYVQSVPRVPRLIKH